jgi:hypothetical protein
MCISSEQNLLRSGFEAAFESYKVSLLTRSVGLLLIVLHWLTAAGLLGCWAAGLLGCWAVCYPKPMQNHRGKLLWEGGEDKRLLHLDIDNNKHKRMKPEMLHLTCGEYNHYLLVVF